MRWGVTVLTIALLIALVVASGCADVSFGSQKIGDFGNTKDEQKAVAFFREKYGDPMTNSGPPRFLEPMVTNGLVNNTPINKVTKFSKDTNSIFFWVFYDNFKKGDTLTLTWTFNGKTVISLQREAGGDFGRAFGEFLKPDSGWVSGTHTITITGGGTSTTATFEIIDGQTQTVPMPYEQKQLVTSVLTRQTPSGEGGGQGEGGSQGNGVGISVDPTTGEAPLKVTCKVINPPSGGGSISEYQWSFGDGTTGYGAKTEHTYSVPGVYLVSLHTTGSNGQPVYATVSIVVKKTGSGLFAYLQNHPRIRAQMNFEIDGDHTPPNSDDFSVWSNYDQWPDEWKDRLLAFYSAYETGTSLPMDIPSYLSPSDGIISYRDTNTARDVYLAQVAYALWLDMSGKVPWHLEDWPDQELSHLLSSKVFFSANHLFYPNSVPHDQLVYTIHWSSRNEATENVLGDPRIPFRFMEKEPEQGNRLLGATPGETGAQLSGWFNDYLFHAPGGSFNPHTFYQDHPRLEDRLKRYPIPPFIYGITSIDPGSVYIAHGGCGGASALFADLMRSVNIPVRKINNKFGTSSGNDETHAGLLFNWSGGGRDARFLLHADDLFTTNEYYNPSPAPKGSDGSMALWDHVWLNPAEFNRAFSLSSEAGIFATGTKEQKAHYLNMGSLLISAPWRIGELRYSSHDTAITSLTNQGFSGQEAEACWQAVDASALAYGDGNRELGFKRLLDGPDSRFGQWCTRTKKCINN